MPNTFAPRLHNFSAMCDPMKPAAPVTRAVGVDDCIMPVVDSREEPSNPSGIKAARPDQER